jgi:hypothetical protein
VPEKLTISAVLYYKIPIAGRVKVVDIQGPLGGTGTEASVNPDFKAVTGNVRAYAKENGSGKHDLYVDLNLDVKILNRGRVDNANLKLLTF